MRRLLLVALLLAGCGSEGDSRVDLCTGTPCSDLRACYDLDAMGRAYCRGGVWQNVLDGRSCGQADGVPSVCRAERADTHRGEQPWCHWQILSCSP